MIKNIFISVLLCSGLFANSFNNNEDIQAQNWRDGFVTAYKAMQMETKLQGLDSNKPFKDKKYVIYFDASKDNISDWDTLMVQMFGYSSSIYKPIRTTNNWIIFGSFNRKATATQELNSLNEKLFKNSDKYHLQLFDNSEGRKFYKGKALLYANIKDLEQKVKEKNKKKLEEYIAKKKKELEANQKVEIVYVDKDNGDIFKQFCSQNSSNTKKETRKKTKTKRGRVYTMKQDGVRVFRTEKMQNPLVVLKAGNHLRIVSIKNNIGKTSKNHFVYMNEILGKKIIHKKNKAKKASKKITNKKPVTYIPEEPNDHYFITDLQSLDVYTLPSFKYGKNLYDENNFQKTNKKLYNNYGNMKYSYIIEDYSGNKWLKLYKQNKFIKVTKHIIIVTQ